jgi:hypothetical protein
VTDDLNIGDTAVERVAAIMRDYRTAYNDPGGPGVDDEDRVWARRVLAALPGTQRERHSAAMEAMPAADLAGTDSAHVFALLRDVADAEPLIMRGLGHDLSRQCAMCGARAVNSEPVEHHLSCPWARVTHLVGVKTDV